VKISGVKCPPLILGVKISGRFLSVEMICSYRSVCTRGSHAVSLRHGNGERWVCDVSVGRPARARIIDHSAQATPLKRVPREPPTAGVGDVGTRDPPGELNALERQLAKVTT